MASIRKLKGEYDSHYALASHFAAELGRQLNSLVEGEGIKLGFPIQARVKSWSSVEEKLKRVRLNIARVHDIQDLIGLRLTLVFLRDAKKIKKLLEDTFDIVKSYDTAVRLGKDQFGYSSFHLVLRVPEEWSAVPSLKQFRGLQAEIQVRTLAQHIWAEVSHQLQYKNEGNVPPEILRSIYRSSALLETVDLEFERVLDERDNYRETIKVAAGVGAIDDEINSDNIDLLLNELLPEGNKSDEGEDYSELISECLALGVAKLSDLRKIIVKHEGAMLTAERENLANRLRDFKKTGVPVGGTEERFKRGVYFTFVGLTRQALCEEFGSERVRRLMASHSRLSK